MTDALELAPDNVAELIAMLNDALSIRRAIDAMPRYRCGVQLLNEPLLRLMALYVPLAVDALTLWASAHEIALVKHVIKYSDNTQIRVIEAVLADGGAVAAVQFGSEPIPVELDATAAWSPAHGNRQLVAA